MRNIKHSFYLMVGVSFFLLMIGNKFILKTHHPKNAEETDGKIKMFLESDGTDDIENKIETANDDMVVVTIISDNQEKSESMLEETKVKPYTIKGTTTVYKPEYTQDELDLLNAKIEGDPLLKKLRENFKALKQNYAELGKKFQKLNQENQKLMKKSKDTNINQSGPAAATKPSNTNNQQAAATKKKIEELTHREKQRQMVLRYSNPFYLLGGYPNITLEYFNSYPDGRPYYERPNFGLHNDMDYCELADMYNLAHPENMFKRKTFFTDYGRNEFLPRRDVMRKIGYDLSPRISKFMPKRIFRSRTMHLDPRINMFFTKRVDLHIYHEIGKHFLCATQMYNHIPGHGVLKRKDMIVDSVDAYALRYKDKSSCFNKHKFFPFSYRLYIKEECEAFFNKINSQQYNDSLKEEPIQYLIKIGFGSHRAQGVFLLDQKKTESVRATYLNGALCGVSNQSLIAQTYVTNPLLLDLKNKFDFRVYMLVASTNPLIVFYHDGFLRVSLFPYDKHSNDRSTHLTNTHLAKDTFHNLHGRNKTLHGMTEQQLRNYQMWTLERLQEYLLSSGKITDKNWLDNYLRPKFKEAFIHIVRMSGAAFWKQSNVFELFGLDFMLDSDLNLWFIECNSSPQFVGTNKHKADFLIKMLKDMFEIQYGYYRSRMKRFVLMIKDLEKESAESGGIDYIKWRDDYADAARNRLEPEYQLSKNNSFEMIMDLNLKGPKAYFGNLKKQCVDD